MLVNHSHTCQDFAILCYVLKYTRNNSNKIHLYHSVLKITKNVEIPKRSTLAILQFLFIHVAILMRLFKGFSNTMYDFPKVSTKSMIIED